MNTQTLNIRTITSNLQTDRFEVVSVLSFTDHYQTLLVKDKYKNDTKKVLRYYLSLNCKSNLSNVQALIQYANKTNIHGIIFPEAFSTFPNRDVFSIREYITFPSLEEIQNHLSKENRVLILAKLACMLRELHRISIYHNRCHANNIFIDVSSLELQSDSHPSIYLTDLDFERLSVHPHCNPQCQSEKVESVEQSIKNDVRSFGLIGISLLETSALHCSEINNRNEHDDEVNAIHKIVENCLLIDSPVCPKSFLDICFEFDKILSRVETVWQYQSPSYFIGRSNELRYLGTKLSEVETGEQWAIHFHGESGIGKQTLISRFAQNQQVKGTYVIKVQGDLVRSFAELLHFEPSEHVRTKISCSEIVNLLKSHFPLHGSKSLIILWPNLENATEESITLFKEILLLHPTFPLFWLLSSINTLTEFNGLSFRDRYIRRILPPFSLTDSEELFEKLLDGAPGCKRVCHALTSYYGFLPSRLVHLHSLLIKKSIIRNKREGWIIDFAEIGQFIKNDTYKIGFDFSSYSPSIKAVLEWLAIRDQSIFYDEIIAVFGFNPTQMSQFHNDLNSSGLIVFDRSTIQFRLPFIREAIVRQLTEVKLEQLHTAIGHYLEEQPKHGDLETKWLIAFHYYHGKAITSFMRIMEEILSYKNRDNVDICNSVLLNAAIHNEGSPLDPQTLGKGMFLLGEKYLRDKFYNKALSVFEKIIANDSLMDHLDRFQLLSRLGTLCSLLSRFDEAAKYYGPILRSNRNPTDVLKLSAIRNITYIRMFNSSARVQLQCLERYRNAINRIQVKEKRSEEMLRLGGLLNQFHFFDEAIKVFHTALSSIQNDNTYKPIVMRAQFSLATVLLKKGDSKKALQLIQRAIRNGVHERDDLLSFQFDQLKIFAMINLGKSGKIQLLMDDLLIRAKVYLLPEHQSMVNLDAIQYYCFIGEFDKGYSLLKYQIALVRRSRLTGYESINYLWCAKILLIKRKNTNKLIALVEERLNSKKLTDSYEMCCYLLAEFYSDDNKPRNALRTLNRLFQFSEAKNSVYPKELLEVFRFRLECSISPLNDDAEGFLSQFDKKGSSISDLIHRGFFYRELMLSALVNKLSSHAIKYYQLSLTTFQHLELSGLTQKVKQDYETAILGWNHSNRDNSLRNCSTIPSAVTDNVRSIYTGKHELSNHTERSKMEQLNQIIHTVSRILDRLNKGEKPTQLIHHLFDEIVVTLPIQSCHFIRPTKSRQEKSWKSEIEGGPKIDLSPFSRHITSAFDECNSIWLKSTPEGLVESLEREANDAFIFPIIISEKCEGILLFVIDVKRAVTDSNSLLIELTARFLNTLAIFDYSIDSNPTKKYDLPQVSIRREGYEELIGNAPAMQEVFKTLWLLRNQDLPVLVLGESGTGKELIARIIHRQSARVDKPFFALNCAAFQDTLIESLLFGHIRGAFSGAISDSEGFFKQASGGVVFLDEVNHMSQLMQGKLLRVLQEGEYYPVGSTKVQRANVRIICAAKNTLPQMVETGIFRQDLYYRINVIELTMPPLRERIEDVKPLADHFIRKFNKLHNFSVKGIRISALQSLLAFSWPGNVRQLENAIRHACLFTKRNSWIERANLPSEVTKNQSTSSKFETLSTSVADLERKMILQALEHSNWNRSEAARNLGISRPTLLQKVKLYKLDVQ